MADIDLPFAASATRRVPTVAELSGGFPCGEADRALFQWLHWWATGQVDGVITSAGLQSDDADLLRLWKALQATFARQQKADLIFYVRADGNDANDGVTNTATGAFATPQGAVNSIQGRYAGSAYKITIQIGAGTFPGVAISGSTGINFELVGAGKANTTLGNASTIGVEASRGAYVTVRSLRVGNTARHGLLASVNGQIQFADLSFAALTTGGRHMWALEGGIINGTNAVYSIDAGAGQHVVADLTSSIIVSGASVTLAAGVAFTEFALVQSGTLRARSMTFTGTATGKKYNAIINGAIDTGGAAVTYFPGDVAGTTSLGGVYA